MKQKRHSVDQIILKLRKADVELGKGKKVLPLLSRPGWRRPAGGRQAELSDPLAAGFPGRIHAAHPCQGISPDPLLRLVLQQEPRDAEEGGRSSGIRQRRRRLIGHGRRGGSVVKSQPPELGDAHQAGL